MNINQAVKLKRNLWAGTGGGIAILPNANGHSEIKLQTSQNASAVQFPIKAGTNGNIVAFDGDKAVIVRLVSNERLSGSFSTQQVNIVISKAVFGSFFENIN